ncbi:MAG: amino acid permease [Planctomycetes bacterium]|nr:amino acid permease [Planctomycetota bacterium]
MTNETNSPIENPGGDAQPTPSSDSDSKPSLRKVLGVFDGVAILIGICIGAGIYSNPQIIAQYLSSFDQIILLWIGAGVFVFISGLIYAELGTRMPHTGGEYVYIARCFGPFAGFMFGWGQLFIVRTSASAGLAIIVTNYLGYFIRLEGVMHTLTSLGVIALFGLLNYVGIQRASIYQKISTVLKVLGLLFIVAVGLFFIGDQGSPLSEQVVPQLEEDKDKGPIGNVIVVIFLIIFAHTGWERIGYSAGEMKNPKRVIPWSLLIGICLVVLLYALTNITYHRTLGMEGMRGTETVASDVMQILIGPVGAILITVLVIVSASGSINGTMMTAPRVYYAMAKDGLFFKWLDYIHPKYRTPSRAIVAHCLWAGVILIVRGQFEEIATGLVFTILIFYGLSTLTIFKMRRENIGGKDIFRVPLYPILPVFFLIMVAGLLIIRGIYKWQLSLADLSFIVAGIPFAIYWCYLKKKPANELMNTTEDSENE